MSYISTLSRCLTTEFSGGQPFAEVHCYEIKRHKAQNTLLLTKETFPDAKLQDHLY